MKKLLGIVVLGLLLSGNAYAEVQKLVCISYNKNWTYELQKNKSGKWCLPKWKECNNYASDDKEIMINWTNSEYGHFKNFYIDRYMGKFIFHKFMHERDTKIEGTCSLKEKKF